MNKVVLIGRMGINPEKRGENGPIVFTLATTEPGYKKSDGTEVADKTEWHMISVFSETIKQFVEKNCKKGSLLLVEGKIHYSSYKDAKGETKKGVEIIADSIKFYSIMKVQQ